MDLKGAEQVGIIIRLSFLNARLRIRIAKRNTCGLRSRLGSYMISGTKNVLLEEMLADGVQTADLVASYFG